VILGVNKAEGKAGDAGALEAYSLGLGEPIRLSAEHGEGMDDLYTHFCRFEGEFAEREAENAPVDIDISEEEAELEADESPSPPPRSPCRSR
jgi:GTP-binding protein